VIVAPVDAALPESVTKAPGLTVWLAPALTETPRLEPKTITLTIAVVVLPRESVTASSKLSTASIGVGGVTNVATAAVALVNVTGGPSSCVHR
jgi:hypothetical protein